MTASAAAPAGTSAAAAAGTSLPTVTSPSAAGTTYPPAAASTKSTEESDHAQGGPSRRQRVLAKGKEKFQKWIDYEPHVTEAASVGELLKNSARIDYPKAAAAYVKRLFPFTNVRSVGPRNLHSRWC